MEKKTLEEVQYETFVGGPEKIDPTDTEAAWVQDEHDIYDEIENLERWQDLLSDMISSNEISQEEYDNEMLKTRYYLDIKTKTYVLDDDDLEIIEKLRSYKLSLKNKYKSGFIDEKEFNTEYIKILRKEYDILRTSESSEQQSTSTRKIEEDIDLPLEEKLRKLHETEVKFNRQVAKKYKIYIPPIPVCCPWEDIESYYNKKLVGKLDVINPEIEEYLAKMANSKKLINYYTSSYEITKVIYNAETGRQEYEFKTIAPLISQITELRSQKRRSNLLTPEEQMYSDRLNILKNRMRQMTREDLLKCMKIKTYPYMSYIERLRENKQAVFKFKEHPENYEMLKVILLKEFGGQEDVKYYKINSDELFKDYVYSRPEVMQSFISDIIWGDSNLTNYTQKGGVSYLAIKDGVNIRDTTVDLGDDLDNYVTIKPMSDELFIELSNMMAEKRLIEKNSSIEIDHVWELRMGLPGSTKRELTKRYLSFNDYLTDFREILIKNSKRLSGEFRDLINEKIRKISYYLRYKEDPEFYLPNGHFSVSELFKNRSEIYTTRRNGTYKLLEYITSYYPKSQVLVERIESDIFDYSSKNYLDNIKKIIFIFKNYQNKLYDLIEGQESIINLLVYEVPLVLPKDDIDMSDKQGSIDKLLQWKPDTLEYDKYQDELNNLNHKFHTFKINHPELSNLYITQIMSEYSEKVQWDKSLRNYRLLDVPEGYIELNFRLRKLLSLRNRLPSRRIYRVSNIKSRIINQEELKIVFKKCKVPEPEEYAILTENLIYGISKSPEDYIYYSELIKQEYRKLCNFFTKVNLRCILDEDGVVRCILSFEPNILSPLITNFLITQGAFSEVDVVRLKNFTQELDSDKILKYIHNLRGGELDAYYQGIMSQVNITPTPLKEIYLKATKIMKSHRTRIQLDELTRIAYNTYKPPVVSTNKPTKTHTLYETGIEYENVKDYIKIGDNYVYGGFYPTFYEYSDTGEIFKENYTRYDLEQLAVIFNIDIVEDSYELYISIQKFIADKTQTQYSNISKEFTAYNPTQYNDYYEYRKRPVKTILYAIRPRKGVEEPGEVFNVTKDPVKLYGVPFAFDENTIPIYSEDLKPLWEDKFIEIQGPFIWQKTNQYNKITSDSYIEIEYRTDRNKIKVFREGVAIKNILKRNIEMVNTCSRFLSKQTCDHENSYSLELKGLKFKCKWISEKCKGIIVESDVLKAFNVNKVEFKDYKNQLWKEALEKSINYVEEVVKLKELNKVEFDVLTNEQKMRLYKYYEFLVNWKKHEKTGDEVDEVDEVDEKGKKVFDLKSYNIVDEFEDILTIKDPVFVNKPDVNEGYKTVTIYKEIVQTMKYPIPKVIKIDTEYLVNGIYVIPKMVTEDDFIVCEIKDTSETILLAREAFRKTTDELITKMVPVFCLVSNENYKYLSGFMDYYWILNKTTYIKVGDDIGKKEEKEKMKFIPLNFINPSENLNGLPLITKSDLFDAMYRTAFNVLITDDDVNYDIQEFVNAQKEAIKFAVNNNVDINKLLGLDIDGISGGGEKIGTITIIDVIQDFESKNPKIFMTKIQLEEIIRKAIREEDKKTLMSHYFRARTGGIDKNMLKEAKELIKTLPDEEEKIVKLKSPPAVASVIGPVKSSPYSLSKRRL